MGEKETYTELPIKVNYEDRVKLENLIAQKTGISIAMDELVRLGGRVSKKERKLWNDLAQEYHLDPELKHRVVYKTGTGEISLKDGDSSVLYDYSDEF